MSPSISLSKAKSPSTNEEGDQMINVPYASAIGSIMYAMLYTRPYVLYALCATADTSRILATIIGLLSKTSLNTREELKMHS